MSSYTQYTVSPSASRLTGSLRDIGYDFPSAVADIVDNCIAASADEISIEIQFAGSESRVFICDNGHGMTANGVAEALRFGSRRSYDQGELGRYGLGLKTASLSQCRAVTVASRRPGSNRTTVRQLDLDIIQEWDEWIVIDPGGTETYLRCRDLLDAGASTVVVWEGLDRVLPEERQDSGWARRRVEAVTRKTVAHLSMVFHRFLSGNHGSRSISLVVNGEKVGPWDPYAQHESATTTLPEQKFEITIGDVTGIVGLQRYVLPARDSFSSLAEFERLAGPLKWNRQQGIYIYRAGRLVQWGGWAGIRAIDEHTKLARVAINFDTDLDPAFNINVAKMRVTLPSQLKQMLERPIHEVCLAADNAYRKTPRKNTGAADDAPPDDVEPDVRHNTKIASSAGLALRTAALQTGDYGALKRIVGILREQAPDLVEALGLAEL